MKLQSFNFKFLSASFDKDSLFTNIFLRKKLLASLLKNYLETTFTFIIYRSTVSIN